MVGAMLVPFIGVFVLAALWFIARTFFAEPHRPTRARPRQLAIYLTGIAVLVVGCTAAILVYRNAAPPGGADDSASYTFEGGGAFAVKPMEDKRYNYRMEQIGGKANVFASDVTSGFFSLWHGQRLAATLAVLSGFVFLGSLVAGRLAGPGPEPAEAKAPQA